MITEQWKQIRNYDNYEVSNTGKVRNIKTGRELKLAILSSGYSIVCLSNKNKRITPTIHRLVMDHFYPNPNPLKFTDINHKDHNRNNNNIENLEWCTHSWNIKYNYIEPNLIKQIKNSLLKEFSSILDKYICE